MVESMIKFGSTVRLSIGEGSMIKKELTGDSSIREQSKAELMIKKESTNKSIGKESMIVDEGRDSHS